ncbi:hypothetical protein [Vibrio parahaemolyticus]|uniref:hypothetical protein n=1 Tax=Vibrio parahaemolyticus TaxID=670 RepID=UPI003D81677B
MLPLQVRISLYAHDKAYKMALESGVTLTKFYELAINHTDLNCLPVMHREVCEGDLIGTRPISPWLEPDTITQFNKISKKYRNQTVAMSAIVNAYCDFLDTSE